MAIVIENGRDGSATPVPLGEHINISASFPRSTLVWAGRGLQPRPKRLTDDDMAIVIENVASWAFQVFTGAAPGGSSTSAIHGSRKTWKVWIAACFSPKALRN